jgi:glycosyltransferase involved in cell wall biosynthesis
MNISVVIPSHNRSRSLPRALDSVLCQTLPAGEIILVDDGSTDDTPAMMAGKYPQCVYLRQANQGVSSARNLGISAASGEWIALLDSDDAWQPDKLAHQMEALRISPDTRICHTDEIWIRHGVRVNPMHKHAKSGGRIFRRCLPLCIISPSSVVLHRSLFEEYGMFDPALPACEDYDLWLRLCAHEEVGFVDRPLTVKYGGHDDQLSHRHWGMDRFRVKALDKLLRTTTLSETDRRAAIETLIGKAGILAQGAEKRGHHQRADVYRQLQAGYRAQLTAT